jgi:hypothetical protein
MVDAWCLSVTVTSCVPAKCDWIISLTMAQKNSSPIHVRMEKTGLFIDVDLHICSIYPLKRVGPNYVTDAVTLASTPSAANLSLMLVAISPPSVCHYHYNRLMWVFRFDDGGKFVPVHLRHFEICEHQIEFTDFEDCQSLTSIFSTLHFVAIECENHSQRIGNHALVIHYEYFLAGFHGFLPGDGV